MSEVCPKCKIKLRVRNGNCFETNPKGRTVYIAGMLDIQVTCFGCGMVRRVKAGDYEIKTIDVRDEVLY